jgi:hypothetical protein
MQPSFLSRGSSSHTVAPGVHARQVSEVGALALRHRCAAQKVVRLQAGMQDAGWAHQLCADVSLEALACPVAVRPGTPVAK